MPPLSGPLPLAWRNGLADGPMVLPIPAKEPKGSLDDGWVWTRPWVAEKLLLLLSLNGVTVPACHHDADVDWSSGTFMASAEGENKIALVLNFGENGSVGYNRWSTARIEIPSWLIQCFDSVLEYSGTGS